MGAAAVVLLGGNRADQSARRADRRREQNLRKRRTGYVGANVETANIVRWELERRDYTPGCAQYAAHLVAHGRQYNFQGQFELARQTGVTRRSAQRYRAQLEADGMIVSGELRVGEMVDGMRAPVTHAQVVRDVSGLLALASAVPKPLRRPTEPARPLAPTDAIAVPEDAEAIRREILESLAEGDRVSSDQIEAFAAALGPKPRPGTSTPRRPISERPPVPVPPGCVIVPDHVIDQWDRDTESLERYAEWLRRQPRPPD